jgi:uncharacterized protein DUF5666
MKKFVCCLAVLMLLSFVAAQAQAQQPPVERPGPGGQMLVGKVSVVNKDSVVISPATGGNPVTVKIGETTRITQAREPAKLSDIKVGQTLICRGELSNNAMQAVFVSIAPPQVAQMLENPEVVARMQQNGGRVMMFGGGGPGGPGADFKPEDMGKKFIVGEVKAINETKLTIARPDGQSQEIEVDENTSFRRGRESITLPDIKVGDFVRGRGEIKNAVFVPQELIVGGAQMRMMMGGPGGAGAAPGQHPPSKPEEEKPKEAPPKN